MTSNLGCGLSMFNLQLYQVSYQLPFHKSLTMKMYLIIIKLTSSLHFQCKMQYLQDLNGPNTFEGLSMLKGATHRALTSYGCCVFK